MNCVTWQLSLSCHFSKLQQLDWTGVGCLEELGADTAGDPYLMDG